MKNQNEPTVQMIPVERIKVLNPRNRSKKKFEQIVSNIASIGLKRPITVSPRRKMNGKQYFNLVCGQGRLEAFIALEQTEIPAVVIKASKEDCFLMSLIENLARRQHLTLEHVKEIGSLHDRGYTHKEIARKIDVHPDYIRGVIRLLKSGEERLLYAVEKDQIPISVAVEISATSDENAQLALLEAYETKKLRGQELIRVRRLLETRRTKGKTLSGKLSKEGKKKMSVASIVRIYKKEAERQKLMVKKAKLCESRLLFIVSALNELFEDENFVNLLRAEGLNSMPKYIAEQINVKGGRIKNGKESKDGI